MKKIFLNTILVLAFFTLFGFVASNVNAGLGISPAQIDNQRLKPGQSFTEEIIISQSEASDALNVTVEPDMGIANSWLSFNPGTNFTIPAGTQRFSLKVTVTPPDDAELKPFNGVIRIKASSAAEAEAGGVAVVKGARVEVSIVTTNIDFADLIVRAITVEESQPADNIAIKLKIENKGNIDAAPTSAILIVEDLNQNLIEELETTDINTVKAGETSEVFAYFKSSLTEGEYFGRAQIYYQDILLREERIVFRISKAVEVVNVVEAADDSLVSKLSENQAMFTIGSIVFLGICLGGLYFFILKNEKYKKEQSKTIRIAFLMLFVILSIVVTIIINYDVSNNLTTGDSEESEEDSEDGKSGNVEGLQTQSINNENLYFIFAQADANSEIIYTASEGSTLKAIEDIEGWYKVEFEPGKFGWLPKSSVRKSE